ncbi:MAG: hypothetical protein LJE70_20150 [Chromatiaceae bacterium]|jgi:hypothetical protein|nr:hypothetical protein [Chromatiaceae bacterium]
MISSYCRFALALLALLAAGCTAATATREPRPVLDSEGADYSSADIRVRLVGALRAGDTGTLVQDPGWIEYILAIENTGSKPLTIHDVKLLNLDGRYLDSAVSYEQVDSPPDKAADVAGSLARSAAGAAAGQAIPYGGTIVGILSGALSASTAESRGRAKQELDQRKLKNVELAPGGSVTGSALLPHVTNPKSLVVDYGHGDVTERIEILFSHRPKDG